VALPDWYHRLGGLTHVEGNLWRSPLPYVEEHFESLRAGGIHVIYSMEEAVPGPLAVRKGFDWRPHFWTDDVPPTPAQMDAFLADLRGVAADRQVVVHCKAGWGRTGSAIACALAKRKDWSAEQALRHYWSRVPAAESVMLSNGQADFVRGYVAARKGRGLY
jgi:hypothetical protein